ncbi:hypothetical protein GEMRC1_010477 [Eukaryota sp. GEM-RC1]
MLIQKKLELLLELNFVSESLPLRLKNEIFRESVDGQLTLAQLDQSLRSSGVFLDRESLKTVTKNYENQGTIDCKRFADDLPSIGQHISQVALDFDPQHFSKSKSKSNPRHHLKPTTGSGRESGFIFPLPQEKEKTKDCK